MVRAKFRVANKSEPDAEGGVANISFTPVCDGSEENKSFFRSTPCGSINIGTINADAAKQFEVGKDYYVDFTPAAEAVAAAE